MANELEEQARYEEAIKTFLRMKRHRNNTHEWLMDVFYDGENVESKQFYSTPVLFDFNDNQFIRILVNALAYESDDYYENFKTLFETFYIDEYDCLAIEGTGRFGRYKVRIR